MLTLSWQLTFHQLDLFLVKVTLLLLSRRSVLKTLLFDAFKDDPNLRVKVAISTISFSFSGGTYGDKRWRFAGVFLDLTEHNGPFRCFQT